MSDDFAKFDSHRIQLANGLKSVAESLRVTADFAEKFAKAVEGSFPSLAGGASITRGPFQQQLILNKNETKKRVPADGEKGIKRKRKPKDPNAPKRPASSYLIFQNEVRKHLKQEHPEMNNQELMAHIGKLWADMKEIDKQIYHNAAADAKQIYSQEKQAYAARSPEEIAAANEATAAAAAAKKGKRSRTGPKSSATIEDSPQLPPVAVEKHSPSDESDDSDEEESSEDEAPKSKKVKAEDDSTGDDDDDDDDEEEKAPMPNKTVAVKSNSKVAPAPAPAPAPASPQKKKKLAK